MLCCGSTSNFGPFATFKGLFSSETTEISGSCYKLRITFTESRLFWEIFAAAYRRTRLISKLNKTKSVVSALFLVCPLSRPEVP